MSIKRNKSQFVLFQWTSAGSMYERYISFDKGRGVNGVKNAIEWPQLADSCDAASVRAASICAASEQNVRNRLQDDTNVKGE